ncbi:hypothetical protein AC1031_015349 [Aphanomyces cochlioides]|nr:hypothetical protein AC1031_015349 [Aphanomyces cochlioides]
MHRVLLRAKSVRFHSTKATSAEAKKPSRSLWPTAIGSAVAAYVAFEAWKRWDDDEKNPARVFHRLPGEKTEEEKKLASEPQVCFMHERLLYAWNDADVFAPLGIVPHNFTSMGSCQRN